MTYVEGAARHPDRAGATVFARYGFNEGVVIEEPFTQDRDGDNLAVDPTRPVTVRTFLAAGAPAASRIG